MNNELRCKQCGKKLAANLEGKIEIVCPKCHHFNSFVQLPLDRLAVKV